MSSISLLQPHQKTKHVEVITPFRPAIRRHITKMAAREDFDGWERCYCKDHSHHLHGDEVDRNTRAMGEIPCHIQDPGARVSIVSKVRLSVKAHQQPLPQPKSRQATGGSPGAGIASTSSIGGGYRPMISLNSRCCLSDQTFSPRSRQVRTFSLTQPLQLFVVGW